MLLLDMTEPTTIPERKKEKGKHEYQEETKTNMKWKEIWLRHIIQTRN